MFCVTYIYDVAFVV